MERLPPPTVVVSMTSIPSRMSKLAPIITNLLYKQTFVFTQLRLYVPMRCVRQNCVYDIPKELQDMQCSRFVICRCDIDHGPATKIIPAMVKEVTQSDFKVDALISVDDDINLEMHAIEELVFAHERNRNAILGFMGVVEPNFFHAEQISNTLTVNLLGGYRAVLYPHNTFLPFTQLFLQLYSRHVMKIIETSQEWPYPVLDDDYVFATMAAIFRTRLMVINTQYVPPERTRLNIQFQHNTDGVSGTSQFAEDMRLSRVWINAARKRIEQRQRRHIRLLHVVCCSPELVQQGKLAQAQHLYGNSHTRFIVHPNFHDRIDTKYLDVYLSMLFHPTIRVNKRPHPATHILASHVNCIVDVQRVSSFLTWKQNTLTFKPVAPEFAWLLCDVSSSQCNPLNVLPILRDINCRVLLPIATEPIATNQEDITMCNLANVVCVFMPWDHVIDHFYVRNYRMHDVVNVMYGPKNITHTLHAYCERAVDNVFVLDGTNARMDCLFGDPTPGIEKQISIVIRNCNTKELRHVTQNTDWEFRTHGSDLLVH